MVAIVGVLAVAMGGTASGAIYCVHAAADPCTGEINAGANLQVALTTSNSSAEADRINVRAGTYSGPFNYLGMGGPVTISGVGDDTVLAAPGANGTTVLDITGESRVEHLHVDVPIGNSGSTQNVGLDMLGAQSVVDGVSIAIPGTATAPMVGATLAGTTFRNGSVTGPDPDNPTVSFTGIGGGQPPIVVEDSTFQISQGMLIMGGGTVRRVSVVGRVGVNLQGESGGGGTFLVEDSLWRSQPTAGFALGVRSACGLSASATVTARNLTLVNPTVNGSPADAVCNNAAFSATLNIASSIALGGEFAFGAFGNSGPATVNVSYSDYSPSFMSLGAGTVNQGAGNLNAPPGFVGASDFRLAPGSPLIDVGDPAGLAGGESATDLASQPRIARGIVGGCGGSARRDIGAYETAEAPLPSSCQPVTPTTKAKKCKKKKHKKHRSAASGKKHKKKKCKKKRKPRK